MRRHLLLAAGLSTAILVAHGVSMASDPTVADGRNRLAAETSPYLLQHASNPVDWYPWGQEAFEAARERNVPILLSVGYSTCYWCHVMERESFEDADVAAVLNERFVCIKLDREERPDVDDIYMTALLALRGSGGWPLNAWLTPPGARGADDPGLEPFYAATYLPKGQLVSLSRNIEGAWAKERDGVLKQATAITEVVRSELSKRTAAERVDQAQIGQALSILAQIYDEEHGGFGGRRPGDTSPRPKFPQPVYLDFLLDVRPTVQDPAVTARIDRMVRQTLDAMSLGGMYDQVGGGFHRYAVDVDWVVPHFEKMMYDNGQLVALYAKSFMLQRDPHDARIVQETLEYVRREMTHEGGAFYSAQDAEVNHREGENYLWTKDQILEVLGPEDAALATDVYSVDAGTNFIDPHHPADGRKNVLVLRERIDRLATELDIPEADLQAQLGRIDAALLEVRERRDQPGLDDKIITGWNGLMIGGMARGALALGKLEYLDAAERASTWILEHMDDGDGGLLRVARDGSAKTPAFLEDYAYFIEGLLVVHRVNAASVRADATFISAARRLTDVVDRRFSGPNGELFDTLDGQQDLIVRTMTTRDGAIPSGQSVMLHNLLELYDLTQEEAYKLRAERLMGAMSSSVHQSPVDTINTTRALLRLLRTDPTVADRLGPAPEAAAAPMDAPVQVMSSVDRLRVPETGSAELTIRLAISDDYHINSFDPGVDGLTPLQVRLVGSSAVALEIEAPPPVPYEGAPIEGGAILAYRGDVELTLRLSRTGEAWSGRPMLLVTYQACSDDACLAPATVELDIAIDP
ncbi:MAG: DUF255 domain-containing protein [Planctomycetota bacterium]